MNARAGHADEVGPDAEPSSMEIPAQPPALDAYQDLLVVEPFLRASGHDAPVRVADRLRRFFASDDDLETALGLKLGDGEHDARTTSARVQRDLAYRAAATFASGESVAAKADEIAIRTMRYYTTTWLRGDNICTECPPRLVGSMKEYLWRALRAHDLPISARQLKRILAD